MNGLSAHELDRLLLALFDDVIMADEYVLLQDILRTRRDARHRYLELSALHNLLELVAQAPLVVTMPSPLSVRGLVNQPLPRRPAFAKPKQLSGRKSPTTQQGRRSMKRTATQLMGSMIRSRSLLATAAILIAAAIFLSMKWLSPPSAATVAACRGAVFSIVHSSHLKKLPKANTLSPGSSLELIQGTVELTFDSGVRGIFQAPETLTLIDQRHLSLKRGTAWFHVPPKAVGFEVRTPRLQIVDLGTEFGVVSKPDGMDEIHVFSGKVEATVLNAAAAPESLVAGESRTVSPQGALTQIDARPERFLTKLPTSLPYLHWSFDETDSRFATDGSHPVAGHVENKLVSPGLAPAFASVPGKFGKALSSSGKNGYMESDWPGIEGSAPRSIAYWIQLPRDQNYLHPVVGWGARKLSHSFFSYIKTTPKGAVAAMSFDSFWLEGSIPINDGQWHHLAVVYTGRSQADGDPEVSCYVDGQLDRMTRYALDSPPKDANGKIEVNTTCTGPEAVPLTLFTDIYSDRKMPSRGAISLAIDELYVFQSALTAQQITHLFHSNQYDPTLSPTPTAR